MRPTRFPLELIEDPYHRRNPRSRRRGGLSERPSSPRCSRMSAAASFLRIPQPRVPGRRRGCTRCCQLPRLRVLRPRVPSRTTAQRRFTAETLLTPARIQASIVLRRGKIGRRLAGHVRGPPAEPRRGSRRTKLDDADSHRLTTGLLTGTVLTAESQRQHRRPPTRLYRSQVRLRSRVDGKYATGTVGDLRVLAGFGRPTRRQREPSSAATMLGHRRCLLRC